MTIYERIKQRRKELFLTADDIAEALGISRSTVYRYESVEIEKFPLKSLEPLAKVLQTTPDFLMGWTENENSITLTNDEKDLIIHFRDLDFIGKAMVVNKILDEKKRISEK